MIKLLGIALLFSLILACAVFLLDNWLYTLAAIAAIFVLVKIKRALFPKKVQIETAEEKRQREAARKEELMETFYQVEKRVQEKNCMDSYKEELRNIEDLAKLGYVPAMMLLGAHKWEDVSYKHYMMASDAGEYQGVAYAYWRFLTSHFNNRLPDDFNMNAICEGLSKGAEAGNADCMFALSMCYAKGWVDAVAGTKLNGFTRLESPFEPSSEKMFFWLKKAYDQGCTSPGVIVMMAEYYAMGKIWFNENFDQEPIYISDGKSVDQKKAFGMLEALMQEEWPEQTHLMPIPVKKWHHSGKLLLTMCYFDGYGTQRDKRKAIDLYCYPFGEEHDTLEVTSKDHDRMTALRKELEESHTIEFIKIGKPD